MSKVWLVAGAGNGLGRNITEAALEAGEDLPAHLVLGNSAFNGFKQMDADRQALAEKWQATSKSVDFN